MLRTYFRFDSVCYNLPITPDLGVFTVLSSPSRVIDPTPDELAGLRLKLAMFSAMDNNYVAGLSGKHRLTTDWVNRENVVYTDKDGAIVRASYARSTVIGYAGFPVVIGDSFPTDGSEGTGPVCDCGLLSEPFAAWELELHSGYCQPV